MNWVKTGDDEPLVLPTEEESAQMRQEAAAAREQAARERGENVVDLESKMAIETLPDEEEKDVINLHTSGEVEEEKVNLGDAAETASRRDSEAAGIVEAKLAAGLTAEEIQESLEGQIAVIEETILDLESDETDQTTQLNAQKVQRDILRAQQKALELLQNDGAMTGK